MLVCAILLIFLRNSKTKPVHAALDENKNIFDDDDLADDESSSDEIEENETEANAAETKEKVTIRTKINRMQKVALQIQQLMGTLAHWGECVKNLVEFKVPFLSWIVVALLICSCFVFYFIPLRYLVMAGGVNKITKRLIRPNSEGSMKRFLNFVSKVPDDEELKQWNSVKISKCRDLGDIVQEVAVQKEGKLRFSRDMFNKKRKKSPVVVPTNIKTDQSVDIIHESNSDAECGNEICDNNENTSLVVHEGESSEEDEVDSTITFRSDKVTETDGTPSNSQLRTRNVPINNVNTEPEIQLSNRSLNFSPRTENKRTKDISVLTKEISNEISRKGIVIRDKIVARSILASKGSKEEHSDDNVDNSSTTERTPEQTPRQRKRDVLLARLKERTNMKE